MGLSAGFSAWSLSVVQNEGFGEQGDIVIHHDGLLHISLLMYLLRTAWDSVNNVKRRLAVREM